MKLDNNAAQAGQGLAQIKATVTVMLWRGQVRKHYIWYGPMHNRSILHTHCSKCSKTSWEGKKEGRIGERIKLMPTAK